MMAASSLTASSELLELARHLKQERLYVLSEKQLLQQLHEEVTQLADKLFRMSWIMQQQRQTLNSLTLTRIDAPPNYCCYRANALEKCAFVDSYKHLGFQDTMYGEFLGYLHENPKVVALCLILGEKEQMEMTKGVVRSIMSAVYGNCVVQDDERQALQLLQLLMEQQLATSDDPRRLIRRGTCAVSLAFRLFTEGLFSTRLYLTAALHEPIMSVLMDDDVPLETDPQKALDSFSPEEREQRFGTPGTVEYRQCLQAHLESVITQLVSMCNRFINGLRDNTYCFPQSLDWIITQLHKILLKSGRVAPSEVRATCADLLMNFFICPVIVNPESYGIITDIMISSTARFNLMQVGQILQGLAMETTGCTTPGQTNDIYSRFPKGCMSSFLDTLIDNMSSSDTPPEVSQLQGMDRTSALITETELHSLVSFFRMVHTANPNEPTLKDLDSLLSNLPHTSPTPPAAGPTPQGGSSPKAGGGSSSPKIGTGHGSLKKAGVSSKASKKVHGSSTKHALSVPDEDEGLDSSMSPDTPPVPQPEDVLVVAFGNQGNECPGMLSEAKVLSSIPSRPKPKISPAAGQSGLEAISEQPEKQLRFSADADASGNSDHLMEAMSIVASEYSMDLEGEMASNLSGRNTPRSAVSLASSSTEHNRPDLIDSTQLPNNSNITDRFGKFEIGDDLEKKKAQGNPETFSETWSTEVIGSDTSEPPSEPNTIERLQEIAESQEDIELAGAQAASLLGIRHSVPDISETASETWSVDVLQSDSEPPEDRMQEVEDVPHEETIQVSSLEADTDRTSSKTSDGPSSRRSSCGSHSISRSSNNDSPVVDDGAIKKDTSSDATEDSNTHYFDPMEDPSMLKGAAPMGVASNNAQPGGLPRKPLQQEEEFIPTLERSSPLVTDKQRKLSKEGPPADRPFSGFLNQFDPLGCRNNYTLNNGNEPGGTASKAEGRPPEDLLQDFDPFSNLTSRSSSTLPTSVGRHGEIPMGAKPKKRSNSAQKISGGHASGGNVSYNELHGLNHDFFNQERQQQRTNPFDLVDDGLSHVNHGFFDSNMPSTQPSPFQPDLLNPFGNFDPSAPVSHTSQSLFANQPQQQASPYRAFGMDSDSGMVSGGSSEHLSHRVVSSISTGSSSSTSFLNTSSESSAKPPDFLTQIGSRTSDEWSGLEQQESGRVQSLPSTSSGFSLGLALTGSVEIEQKPVNNVSFQRSHSTDASYVLEDGLGKPDVADSDKGRSWFKKKVSQIHKITGRKSTKGKPGVPGEREEREKDRDKDQDRKNSDTIQIIPNPALVQHAFEDERLKATSVPETSSEDILNKYRGLRRTQSSDLLEDDHSPHDASNLESSTESSGSHSDKPDSGGNSDQPDMDPENLEESYAFIDAKRKLRIVLRSADFHTLPWLTNFTTPVHVASELALGRTTGYPENKLVAFLKVQLAEAMNLQDRSLMAQLRETLRCVQTFDNDGCRRLLASLREDYEMRAPYIAYLVRSRKGLASSRAHLERLLERVERDKAVVNKYFTMVLVRLFLERQEKSILKFIEDFKALTAADEKTHLVKYFLKTLNNWILDDPIWEAASETQMADAEVATERAIMSRIYKLALYPNDEADVDRDRVLQAHIYRLSKVITVHHKALQIPEKYGREAPWPAAQAEILNINVYKTPKDKIRCVYRCCMIIMNLLSLANENSVPGADDFSPVLMYVLIKANPSSLLSTVQYVNSFYFEGDQFRESSDPNAGEEQYWWMQFCAAIEYIKTLDDRK